MQVKQIRVNFVTGQRLQGQWRDKLPRCLRHKTAHRMPLLCQQAYQFRSFIRSNATSHTHNDICHLYRSQ